MVPSDDALEGLDDLLGARMRRAIGCPQVPRPEVHHGVGEERRGLQVVGKLPCDVPHRVGVGAVEGLALGRGIGRVAFRQRLDQRALRRPRASGEALRLTRGAPGLRLTIGVRRVVVVRALRDGDTPEAHRTLRIQARRLSERLLRLVVVERVDQPQALIEPALRVGRSRRDPVRVAAERIVEHRTAVRCVLSVRHVGLLRRARLGTGPLRGTAGRDEQERWKHDPPMVSHVVYPLGSEGVDRIGRYQLTLAA